MGDLPGLDPGVTELSRDILLLPFETGLATLEACLAVCKNEASSLFLKACAFASCMSVHAWTESARALALPGNLRSTGLLSASWQGNITPSSRALPSWWHLVQVGHLDLMCARARLSSQRWFSVKIDPKKQKSLMVVSVMT